jgi:hypothetical protein
MNNPEPISDCDCDTNSDFNGERETGNLYPDVSANKDFVLMLTCI